MLNPAIWRGSYYHSNLQCIINILCKWESVTTYLSTFFAKKLTFLEDRSCLSYHKKRLALHPWRFLFVCSYTWKNNSLRVSDSTSDYCTRHGAEYFPLSLVWLPLLILLLVSYLRFQLLLWLPIHLPPSRMCLYLQRRHCYNSLSSKFNSSLARLHSPRRSISLKILRNIVRDHLASLKLTCHWPILDQLFHL